MVMPCRIYGDMAKPDGSSAEYSVSFDDEISSTDTSTSDLLSQTLAMAKELEGSTSVSGLLQGMLNQPALLPGNLSGKSSGNPKSTAMRSSLSSRDTSKSTQAAVSNQRPPSSKPPLSSHGRKIPRTMHSAGQAPESSLIIPTPSMTKQFTDSVQIRNAVFGEWLTKKQERISREKVRSLEAKRAQEEEKMRRVSEKEERTLKALERWKSSKEVEISSKTKQQREEARRKKEAEEEKRQKAETSKLAASKWREERTKQLVNKHRTKKKDMEEVEERKQQEAEEKAKSSVQAFDIWKQKKDEVIKDDVKKQREQENSARRRKQEEAVRRKDESLSVFDVWKVKKYEKIKHQKSLYTYTETPQIHTRAWCPARSIRYTYQEGTNASSRPASRGTVGSQTPRPPSRSFDSSLTSSVGSHTETSDNHDDSRSGTRKTVQVCCQTLEYWCTCDDP